MENGKDFSSMIAAAMENPEQLMQINKMLNKANFELNRSENNSANIRRIAEKEIWKNLGDVAGFEQYSDYEVSTFGRVKSLNYGRTGKERILKLQKNWQGYLYVEITTDKKQKKFKIHRIVASAFVNNDNPEVKTVCNHINHNPKDNHYKNLEWCTQKENIQAFNSYDSEKVEKRNKKLSEANKGKKHSDESRKKMSEAKFGAKNHNFGKSPSEETRLKLSITNTGYSHTPEARQKISDAAKAAHARKREEKAKLVS